MGVNPKKAKPGGRRATLKEVAAEVGVSPATVSNAYNRPDQLSGGVRARVFEAARRLGYAGPDPMARGLRRGRAGAVGVLYENRLSYSFADPAQVLFLQGVSSATEEAGLWLLLLSGAPGEERDPASVGGAVVDGFVVCSMSDDDPLVDAALGRRLPAVIADQPRVGGVPYVGIDDEGAARAAAEHLLGLGHERFGVAAFQVVMGNPEGTTSLAGYEEATYWVSRARLRGYAGALRDAGLSPSDVPVHENPGNDQEKGRRAAEVLLGQEPRPTAILALSDQLAFGVIEGARWMGLSVPGDLSVVGFDDVPEAARSDPPLTTVRQPHAEKGLRVGRMLVSGLGGEEPSGSEVLPTELVVRGSTAPPGQRAGYSNQNRKLTAESPWRGLREAFLPQRGLKVDLASHAALDGAVVDDAGRGHVLEGEALAGE